MWPGSVYKAYLLMLGLACFDHSVQAMGPDTSKQMPNTPQPENVAQQQKQQAVRGPGAEAQAPQANKMPEAGKPPAGEGIPKTHAAAASSSAPVVAAAPKRSTAWAWVPRDEVPRPWATGWFPLLGDCRARANGSQCRVVEVSTQTMQSEAIELHELSLLDQGEKYQNWAEEIAAFWSGGSKDGDQVWDDDYRRYAHYKFATRYLYHKVHDIKTARQ